MQFASNNSQKPQVKRAKPHSNLIKSRIKVKVYTETQNQNPIQAGNSEDNLITPCREPSLDFVSLEHNYIDWQIRLKFAWDLELCMAQPQVDVRRYQMYLGTQREVQSNLDSGVQSNFQGRYRIFMSPGFEPQCHLNFSNKNNRYLCRRPQRRFAPVHIHNSQLAFQVYPHFSFGLTVLKYTRRSQIGLWSCAVCIHM